MGLDHKALKTIYVEGILPLLVYGAPVWINVMGKESYKSKLIRVQRLINIKTAKAYRTVSHEALCTFTGMTPIEIKIEEVAQIYYATRGNTKDKTHFERGTGVRKWQHPADVIIRVLKEEEEKSPIQIFTNGSRSGRGVCSGVAIYRWGESINTIQCRLNKKCTNNQAERFAVLTALEHVEKIQTTDKIVTIYTDIQRTLDKLQNSNIHTYIVEEIRRKITEMKESEWKITLCWVKAHAGVMGNELADTSAKRAATNKNIPESYNRIPKSVVMKDLEEEIVKKWQRKWTQTTKGRITKEYFPDVSERLKMKLQQTQNFTAIVSGHGKTRDYLHRFKIIEESTCPCGKRGPDS